MTPRDRILAAMQLKTPDRVPLMCQFSFGFINQQLKGTGITPMEVWLDAEKYAEALIFLREKFRFDGILVSVHGHYKDWRSKIKKLEIINGTETATFEDRKEVYVDDDLPVGEFFKERQVDIQNFNVKEIPDELDYIPASKNCYVFIDMDDPFRIFDIVDNKIKKEYSVHGEVSSSLDYLLDLLGYEKALMAMVLEPKKCKDILDKFTHGVIRMAKGICSKNIDAIKISSPFAGMGFISPEFYRNFELPYLTRIAGAIKEEGKFVYLHTCGHINDRLELMRDSGISGLECLDPPPIGNAELKNAFDRIGKDMFIKGNIDSVYTLLNGTNEDIVKDVRERLEIGMNNPGFILSTACSIAPKVNAEKVKLLSKIVEEYGRY